MLSDMGADAIHIVKQGEVKHVRARNDGLTRNRRSMIAHLKSKACIDVVLPMVEQVDAVSKGFRPGIIDQLGAWTRDLPAAQLSAGLMQNHRFWGQGGPMTQGGVSGIKEKISQDQENGRQ